MTTDTTNALRALVDEWADDDTPILRGDAAAAIRAALATAQPEAKPEERAYETPGSEQVAGDVHRGEAKPEAVEYPLAARLWQRDSTQEWVLEISGTINGTAFISRHSEPLTTPPEDAVGLPTLHATRQAQGGGEDSND